MKNLGRRRPHLTGVRGRLFRGQMTTTAMTNARRASRPVRNLVGAILSAADASAEGELFRGVLDGLPVSEVTPLLRLGFTDDELACSMDMNRRTLTRRRASKARLSTGESDRLVRLARIVAQAIRESFETPEQALCWLRESNNALGGKTPLDSLRAESGAALVRRILGTIAYGGVL